MKGVIIIPEEYYGKISHMIFEPLFKLIRDNLGFEQMVMGKFSKNKVEKYDIVVILKTPQKSHPNSLEGIENLTKSKKLVCYFSDVHPNIHPVKNEDNVLFTERANKVLKRADLIFYSYKEAFLKFWYQYQHKAVWLPHFVGYPEFAKSLPFNNERNVKVLLSGANGFYYPLRKFAISNPHTLRNLMILKHPGYNIKTESANVDGFFIGTKFYKELNNFYSAISCTSILNYTLMKHFEIPSVGTLLLSDVCSDMNDLGFIPSVNYIQIDMSNMIEILQNVKEFHKNFDNVRKNGRQFVLENHTVYHRFETFKKVLEEL
jgi:hypothetical protein